MRLIVQIIKKTCELEIMISEKDVRDFLHLCLKDFFLSSLTMLSSFPSALWLALFPYSFCMMDHFLLLVPGWFMTPSHPSSSSLQLSHLPLFWSFHLILCPNAFSSQLALLNPNPGKGILSLRSWHRGNRMILPIPPTQGTEFTK